MNKQSLSRIEQFRQLKKSIRRSNKFLIVGIDVGKKSSVACVTDTMKNIYLKKFKFSNTREDMDTLINKVTQLKTEYQKKNIVWAMEPTGNYHKPLVSYLGKKKFIVVGVSTVAAKENRKSLDGRWRKSDPKDAYNITDLVSQGKMYYQKEDQQTESLKSLLKTRDRLTKRLSSIRVRLRNNHFARYFPEFDSYYKDILDKEVMQILKYFPTAEDISKISFYEFIENITKKRNFIVQEQRLYEIWNKAKISIGQQKHDGIDFEMKITLSEIVDLQKNIKQLDKKIESLCRQSKYLKFLLSVPGFGPIISAIFLAYVGDIKNYTHSGQLTKLAGLDLEYAQSGRYHGQASISKKGCSILRYALCHAAKISLKNKSIKVYFEKELKLRGATKTAKAKLHIKLVDKLLRAVYTVLDKQEPFNVTRFLNPVKQAC